MKVVLLELDWPAEVSRLSHVLSSSIIFLISILVSHAVPSDLFSRRFEEILLSSPSFIYLFLFRLDMIKTTVDSNVSLFYLNVPQICVTVVKRMNFNQLAVSTERTDDCPPDEHLENLIPVFYHKNSI